MVNKFILAQLALLLVVAIAIFAIYPRADFSLNGNQVAFRPISANVIVLSESPDFSNPRYLDIEEDVLLRLEPGKYYWKADNGLIEGFGNEFVIDSEVGLELVDGEDGKVIKNVGDVLLKVEETEDGGFVGHVSLSPNEEREVSGKGLYKGGQADE